MATFTATANSSTTLGYAMYGKSSWNTGSSDGACQGAYQATSASNSRVGVIVFSGAGEALKGKAISNITLTITCSSSGSSYDDKVLSFCKANYQSLKTDVQGSEQVGDALGTLTGKFYSNTTTHVLSATSNAALFEAMKAYLAAGNSAVVLYNGETSSSSGFSTNYARVTKCVITVTYENAAVWYNNDGTWLQCVLWYRKDGQWIQCVPYYNQDGTWIQV